jgi:hypothetical protein
VVFFDGKCGFLMGNGVKITENGRLLSENGGFWRDGEKKKNEKKKKKMSWSSLNAVLGGLLAVLGHF